MALNPDALNITLSYEGGSITLPVGNAKSLFGDDGFELLRPQGEEVTVRKPEHDRVRIIGDPPKKVKETIYTTTKWPRSNRSNNAGGTQIVMTWEGSDGSWIARMTGSASDLGTFLNNSSPKAVVFSTSGSNYGPFIRSSS